MSINGRKPSPEQLEALFSDIRERLFIQRTMAPHTQSVIEAELGVSVKTIQRVEHCKHGSLRPYRVSLSVVREIWRRRQIYNLAKERLEALYSVAVLCERHQMSSSAIERYIRLVKDQLIAESLRREAA